MDQVYLELLMPQMMKLLESTENNITYDENGENVHHLKIAEVVLVHCNIVNNGYQHNSRSLHTFFPNRLFGQLLNTSSKNFIFLKTFNSEFLDIEVWSTDRNSKPLEIQDK